MRKLDIIKQRDEEAARNAEKVVTLSLDQSAQLDALKAVQGSVDRLYEAFNGQEPLDLTILSDQLQALHGALDFSEQFKALREEVKNSKVETVDVKQFSELLAAVKENKPLPVKIDLTKLEKAIIQVERKIQEGLVPDQGAENYQPIRRVIKIGNKLVFDDVQTSAGRGGGGSNLPYGSVGNIVNGQASNTDGSSTEVIGAQGVGVKTCITDVTLTNTSATAVYVELKNGSTSKWTFPVPANTAGVTHSFATPLVGAENAAWNFDPSSAVSTVICSLNGFKA